MYELYQNDNVLAVRRKTLVSAIIPENGDGIPGGFTASQTRNQTERDRANDFRLRAKTVNLHKDSVNHKAVMRVSQKKGVNGEILDHDDEGAIELPLVETMTSVQAGIDIETGNA